LRYAIFLPQIKGIKKIKKSVKILLICGYNFYNVIVVCRTSGFWSILWCPIL